MRKLLIVLLSVFITTVGYSQDTIKVYQHNLTDSVFQINEYTIIGVYRATDKMPITQTTMKLDDIEFTNQGQDVPMLLGRTPSMTMHSDNGGYNGYTYMRLRGIDQTRINMTLNGVPLNEPEDQGVYFSNYPDFLSSMNSVQIQRGAGTSSNGSASYAGSINFESKNLKSDEFLRVRGDHGSFNTSRIMGEYHSGGDKVLPLYIRLSNSESDGYKRDSENKSKSAFLSTGYFTGNNIFKFNTFIGHQENLQSWLGSSLDDIKKDRKHNSNRNEADNFTQFHAQLQHVRAINSNSTLTTTVYYNYLKGNYDFDLNAYKFLPEGTIPDGNFNYWLESNFIGLISNYTYKNDNFNFYTGVHVNQYSRQHIGKEKNLGRLYKNTGYKNEISLFTKVLYTIGSVDLFGDVQFRHTNFDYDGDVVFKRLNWNFINPKVGLNYHINNNLKLYGSLGLTSREPTRTDILQGEDNLGSVDGIADIKTEKVFDKEFGFIYNNKNLYLQTNFYHMRFYDEIILNGQVGSNSLALHSNVAKSIRYGVEIDVKYKIGNFIFNNATSLSSNRIKDGGNETTHVMSPSFILNQDVIYNIGRFDLSARFRYQGRSYLNTENTNTIDGFNTIDLGATYSKDVYKVGIKVNNIFDTQYFSYGQMNNNGEPMYFVGVPTNVNVFIDIKF